LNRVLLNFEHNSFVHDCSGNFASMFGDMDSDDTADEEAEIIEVWIDGPLVFRHR
jgi:hypothetical protein